MTALDVEALLAFTELNKLEAMELCDTLWLARYMKTENQHYQVKENKEIKTQQPSSIPSTKNTSNENEESNKAPLVESQEIEEDENMALSMGQVKSSEQQSFYVSHKGYFENRTKLSMYLRDFKEKIDSRNNMVFNEEKTVDYIASTGVSHVFVEPKKEKRYQLYVVIDKSDSMILWSEMVEEYSNLLLNKE